MNRWIKDKLQASEFDVKDGAIYWRERIYNTIIFTLSIVVLPGYIFGMYMSIKHQVYTIAVVDTVIYTALILMMLYNPFKLKVKINILLSLPLLIGSILVIVLGPSGAGLSYFIGFIILTSILHGLKGAIYGLVIHIVFSTFIAFGIHLGWFGNLLVIQFTTMGWITIATNSLAICSITSIPLSVLLQGLNRYITRHKTLEFALKEKINQLATAKQEADKANELKTKFLANMSHEVRTPLNVIMGFSEIVQANMYENTTQRNRYLKTINQNGHYLLNIIENILDISMIESKQLKYNISSIYLNDFMREIQQVYQINNTQLDIVFVPSRSETNICFHSDETRLKQVLINLINNAIKYTDEGSVTIAFEMADNDTLQFIVSDTGVGIHPDNIEQIFERFVKIESEDTVKDGTGLGLAISKSIVEALGGKIFVESILNKGSVFTVALPIRTVKASQKLEDTLTAYE